MATNDQALDDVAGWLKSAQSAVGFTGAGISTESGIPDFRSPGGVWSRLQPVYFQDFLQSPTARLEYWQQRAETHLQFATAQPNGGHQTLASWQQAGRLKRVITQNIDGLHTRAGNDHVVELHGTALQVGCLQCGARFDSGDMLQEFFRERRPPDCPDCGGLLKHATISFGQSLDERVLEEAARLSREADLFLAIGSSLVVQPAASLPVMARESGARLVIINREPTPLDRFADQVLRGAIGELLLALDRRIGS